MPGFIAKSFEAPDEVRSPDKTRVDVVIRSLRRKLGAVADRIETVRGVGYRLR